MEEVCKKKENEIRFPAYTSIRILEWQLKKKSQSTTDGRISVSIVIDQRLDRMR